MKMVRIVNNEVQEILPDTARPVADWYGEAFAAQCVAAPDKVEQHWTYDPETGTFSPPAPLPEPDPSDEPVTWSALAASIREGVNEV